MNPPPSLRTLDKKVDNLGRKLREELKGVESKYIVEEGLHMNMYMNTHFKRGLPAELVNAKELPVSSRRNAREGNMNPPPSLRTLDKKVDNLGRKLREELKGVESKFIVEEGLHMNMYMNTHFKRGLLAALVNAKELLVSSRRNASEGNMNHHPSLRTLDKKVDNLGRKLREELKGVKSKAMEKMTYVEINILDAIMKSE
ncbi:hypothetical protein ACE6H2_026250 [Prunus campanulata]